jgi:TonB family protein
MPVDGTIDLGSCTPAHSYRVSVSGCDLELYWAANLSDYVSQRESASSILARIVKYRRSASGWAGSTLRWDGDIAIDGNPGREMILEYSGREMRAWGFLLDTTDIEGPRRSHDFVALLATDDGSETGSGKSDYFFGSMALYLPFPKAGDLVLRDDPDDLLEVLKSMVGPDSTTKVVPLNRPSPSYTAEAASANVEGTVRARALVGADGMVKEIELIDHLPCGLDHEAILAIKRMRFKPATAAGKPAEAWTEVNVEFRHQR